MALKILPGTAAGDILACEQGLSFWGGVDPGTGRVIDAHHPLHGQCLTGRILMLPTSRGSCTGSGVLLQLLRAGLGPAALIFREPEDVLTLGALVGRHVFGLTLPVLRLDASSFDRLARATRAEIGETMLRADGHETTALDLPLVPLDATRLQLSPADEARLAGESGEAAALAQRILRDMALIQGAETLLDITRVHIDGCLLASEALLDVAEVFAGLGARVTVPTTMNSISVDHDNWRSQGTPEDFGRKAARLADAYLRMGAAGSFTCAPYLLESVPEFGEPIAWAESNAVIYANSVLGARTPKHPDFLDLSMALTGRAPAAGVYLDGNRAARRLLRVELPATGAAGVPVVDDAFWPLLGYVTGLKAPDRIPLLTGLERLAPSADDLKALCAAFGTTSAAPMLHVAGHTPESDQIDPQADSEEITLADLLAAWTGFNPAGAPVPVDLVAFGSPHFSLEECRNLARLMDGRTCHPGITALVTLGRGTLAQAQAEGLVERLSAAGVTLVQDLCWCSISEPVFPPAARTVMTNSGKYAHYGPGLSGRDLRFGSLSACADAAVTGQTPGAPPFWLDPAR
ncbi:aconitase X [Roseibium aestuarii]|uniref:Aconitase X n=1 Tax=Roseibium aestuarii TaxID=2600299 RepID=A0ABW4JYF3_9HYPH|nr:aconitase family protein [Roseibium aestuarii]